MVGRPVKVPTPQGQMADGVELEVKESTERWSTVTLEDDTVLRVKLTVASAIRIDGQYDTEGNPLYAIKGAGTTVVVSVPESLRQKSK